MKMYPFKINIANEKALGDKPIYVNMENHIYIFEICNNEKDYIPNDITKPILILKVYRFCIPSFFHPVKDLKSNKIFAFISEF